MDTETLIAFAGQRSLGTVNYLKEQMMIEILQWQEKF